MRYQLYNKRFLHLSLWGFLLLCCALVSPNNTYAHSLGQSYLFLNLNTEVISGRIEITIADLNSALSIDLPADQSVVKADLERYAGDIANYLQSRVALHPEGAADGLHLGEFDLMVTPEAQYLVAPFTVQGHTGVPSHVTVEYTVLFDRQPQHRAFLVIENDWKTGTFDNESRFSMVFEPGNTSQTLDLNSSTSLNGIWSMVRLGTHHIWIGIDHVLFLIVLLIPAVLRQTEHGWEPVTSFRPAFIYVLKIVTLFTVAHTITLSIATLTSISLSARLVESIIAISIAVAALDILYPIFHRRIWWVVFIFGLFHGFGFASVLSEIGIPPEFMGYSLLAFNVGVELGQLAIVCVIFPLLYIARASWFYNRVVMQLGSTTLIAVSLYWFVERGFLINLPLDENFRWFLHKYNITNPLS